MSQPTIQSVTISSKGEVTGSGPLADAMKNLVARDDAAREKRRNEQAEKMEALRKRDELMLAFCSTDEGKAIHADFTNAKSQVATLHREQIELQYQIDSLKKVRVDSLIKKHNLAGCLTPKLAPSIAQIKKIIAKRVSAALKNRAADAVIETESEIRKQACAEFDSSYQAFAAEFNSLTPTAEIAACIQKLNANIKEVSPIVLVRDAAAEKIEAGIRALEQSRQVGTAI